MRTLNTCTWIILMLTGCGTAFAAAVQSPLQRCPDFPTPEHAEIRSVADNMTLNGIPMALLHLESKDSPETVLAYYRSEWAATAKFPAPVEYPLGPWQVIASQRGDCFYTVQVKPLGMDGTEGLLGVSAPPEQPIVTETVPMLPGSTMLNDLRQNDSGKTARTVLLKNGFSTATNADFYVRNLTAKGWTVTGNHALEQPGRQGNVLLLRNGIHALSIIATPDAKDANKSTVVLNYVDQP